MKSQKGITLTSLAIYITVVLIVVSILAVIMASFQSNMNEIYQEGTNNAEIDKFNVYFLKEVKKQGNGINPISDTDSEILFKTGNKYTFNNDDRCIYLNENIKISENIETCKFSSAIENEKTVIKVEIKAVDAEEKIIEYVLNEESYTLSYDDENNYINEESVYIELEYIESTGTQYINTGYYPTTEAKIEMDISFSGTYSPTANPTNYAFMGAYEGDYGFAANFGSQVTESNRIYYWTHKKSASGGAICRYEYPDTTIKSRNTIIVTRSSAKYGNIEITTEKGTENVNMPLIIFGRSRDSSVITFGAYNMKLYSCKIYDGDTMIRDYIPVLIKKDNKVALYDKLNDKYYYNEGTGEFVAGPEI